MDDLLYSLILTRVEPRLEPPDVFIVNLGTFLLRFLHQITTINDFTHSRDMEISKCNEVKPGGYEAVPLTKVERL